MKKQLTTAQELNFIIQQICKNKDATFVYKNEIVYLTDGYTLIKVQAEYLNIKSKQAIYKAFDILPFSEPEQVKGAIKTIDRVTDIINKIQPEPFGVVKFTGLRTHDNNYLFVSNRNNNSMISHVKSELFEHLDLNEACIYAPFIKGLMLLNFGIYQLLVSQNKPTREIERAIREIKASLYDATDIVKQ